LSTHSLGDIGLDTILRKESCIIQDEDKEFVLRPIKRGGLFILESKDLIPKANIAYGGAKSKASLDVWHQRLGHISKAKILDIMDKMPGLDIDKDVEDEEIKVCDGCQLGKQTRDSFGKAIRKETPLELIHSDLCGEFQEMSLGGAKYFISFIDDNTRFAYLEFLKDKNCPTLRSLRRKSRAHNLLRKVYLGSGVENDIDDIQRIG